jgi:hypothetical protein
VRYICRHKFSVHLQMHSQVSQICSDTYLCISIFFRNISYMIYISFSESKKEHSYSLSGSFKGPNGQQPEINKLRVLGL